MSRLSSETLFHFTSYSSLLGILRKGFFPRLSVEDYSTEDASFIAAIPMVCFCDIPLSSVKEHSDEYGKFAIGVKKDWAIRKGFSPVCYYHNDAEVYKRAKEVQFFLLDVFFNPFGELLFPQDKVISTLASQYNVLFHMKKIEGVSQKNSKLKKFYDEREWRFIPRITQPHGDLYYLNECYFSEEKFREENERLEKNPIELSIEDLNYIVIENEDQRTNIIAELKASFSAVDDLLSLQKVLILSQDQIRNDF